MAAEILIKIDADTAAYIAKIAKMAEAHEKVKKTIAGGGDAAKGLTEGFVKMAAVAALVAESVRGITSSMKGSQDLASDLSKKMGGMSASLAPQLASLGFNSTQQQAMIEKIKKGTANTTPEQGMAYIASRAAIANQERNEYGRLLGISPAQRSAAEGYAANAFLEGGAQSYGDNGTLLQNRLSGRGNWGLNIEKDAAKIAASRNQAAPSAIFEGSLRSAEQGIEYDTAQQTEQAGLSRRLGRAIELRRRIKEPIAAAFTDMADEKSFGIGGMGTRAVDAMRGSEYFRSMNGAESLHRGFNVIKGAPFVGPDAANVIIQRAALKKDGHDR